MITTFVVCLTCHVPFPYREDQSASSAFADVSLDSLPFEAKFCPFRESVPERLLENAAVRMSLKSVRWKVSLTSSWSKMDTTENCFSPHSSKKSSVPDSPANKEKATANGFADGDRDPSSVSVGASPGSCPHRRHCLEMCPVVLRHCLPSFDSSECDLCSCR